jgi:hypothetical protein
MAHSLAELASWKHQQCRLSSGEGSTTSQTTPARPAADSPGAAIATITRIVEARMVCRYRLHQFSQKLLCISMFMHLNRVFQQNRGKETKMSALAGVMMNDQTADSVRAEVLKVSGSLRCVDALTMYYATALAQVRLRPNLSFHTVV